MQREPVLPAGLAVDDQLGAADVEAVELEFGPVAASLFDAVGGRERV